ncbi:phosphotransferase [Dactylosporangium aurantiacum]|uniref:Phosphotransferase n=1 Tax=Dactylosporangium aurantiacum TaxID=35754 RepID=A0A9Q9MIT0_9ACTN|nr:phosphotransferase [Dactylosporangium aurantiacum]MDG6105484.1 phosphotransferase [Dactylosporangium aurantiacum]UWZ53981.1 phosphotransferase [Dactylosporangium aurantiacum]
MAGVHDIAAALGVRLDDARPVPARHGQRRAFFARRDGEPVVAKWGLDEDLPEKLPYVAAQVPVLRGRGIPAAPVLAHAPMPGGGYAWLQPRLPGRPATPGPALLAELLTLLDRMRDAPPGAHRSDHNVWVTAVVRDDLAGYWANAAAVGPAARALCARVRAWAAAQAPPPPAHDYVHLDLNLGNVLTDGGRITGLVDLENLGVGSRAVDAARLAYEWHTHGAPGLADFVHYGRSCQGDAGWRYAVAHEVACRVGFRSEHTLDLDPATQVTAAAAYFDAVHAG